MVWRVFRFFLFQLVGGLAGCFLPLVGDPAQGALVGVVLASAAWVAWDLRRGGVVLVWLRDGDLARVPRVGGLWGEAAGRAYRQFRVRTKALQESEARLQEFLAAIQASPNGVVLLDSTGRIEWCNQTAASHFGFDPAQKRGRTERILCSAELLVQRSQRLALLHQCAVPLIELQESLL